MQQDLLFSLLVTDVISGPGHPRFGWFQVDGHIALLQGYYSNKSGGAFQDSLVFSLSPLSVKMLEYFKLHASNVA